MQPNVADFMDRSILRRPRQPPLPSGGARVDETSLVQVAQSQEPTEELLVGPLRGPATRSPPAPAQYQDQDMGLTALCEPSWRICWRQHKMVEIS